MKAIITAAGRGSRLGALTRFRPKGLLPINGESLIARQLRILSSYGIHDVAIVTGYCAETVQQRFQGRVTFFNNPNYSTTTSTGSLSIAMDFMDTDIIIMACDTVFPQNALQSLITNQQPYCLLVDTKQCDEEAVKVMVEGGKLLRAGKDVPAENALGEWTYISRIRKAGLDAYKEELQRSAVKKYGRSQIFMGLVARGLDVYCELLNEEWTEVDFVKDYVNAKRIFEKNQPL